MRPWLFCSDTDRDCHDVSRDLNGKTALSYRQPPLSCQTYIARTSVRLGLIPTSNGDKNRATALTIEGFHANEDHTTKEAAHVVIAAATWPSRYLWGSGTIEGSRLLMVV